jgi:DNA-binding MarR family transcriptional regulator
MSSDFVQRERLIRSVVAAIRANSDQVDRLDQQAASSFRLNRTDTRALEIVSRTGPLTARKLAEELGITTGGVTTVIDRLERAGYARRQHDVDDRRRVLVEATELTRTREQEVFGDLVARSIELVNTYSDADLTVIKDFLERSRAMLATHADRLAAATERAD